MTMPALSPYRVFSDKNYVTDFTVYATKEAATAKITEFKQQYSKILARVVARKTGFVIYFEESAYQTIFGALPPKLEITNIPRGEAELHPDIKPIKRPAKKRATKTVTDAMKLITPASNRGPKKTTAVNTPPSIAETKTPVVYGPPPQYLLDRMSKDARKYYLTKDEDLQRIPAKQIDRTLEIFTAELLKFDPSFEKERPVVGRLKEISDILTGVKKKYDEEDIARFLEEKVKVPLNNGKFTKVLQKLDGYNARTVADSLIKNIGRARKECPLSDYALSQEIAKILKEKYPGKYKD